MAVHRSVLLHLERDFGSEFLYVYATVLSVVTEKYIL